jgi:hypothetical protein
VARSRNIKPGFFRNADLAELSLEARLLFIGLWTLADRAGRLEDRPKQIKMEIFPADNVDCDKGLSDLAAIGVIERYEVGGRRCIQVTNFAKHQNPHSKEAPSTLPPPNCKPQASPVQAPDKHQTSPVQSPDKHQASMVQAGLIPDSGFLIPDSFNLIADSGESTSADLPREPTREPQPRATRLAPDWTLPESWALWAMTERSDLDAAKVAEKFRDFWCAKAGKAALKLDWQATWRNWVRDEHPPPAIKVGRQLETFKERDARVARDKYAEMTGTGPHSNIIDMVTDLVEANSLRALK